jgi:hypothetical protein
VSYVPRRRRRTETKSHSWLDLLQSSGPFVTLPVLQRVFGDTVPPVATGTRAKIRVLAEAMMASNGQSRELLVDAMLDEAFDWGEHRTGTLPMALAALIDEHAQTVAADFAFEADDDGEAESSYRLLGIVTPWGTHPLLRTTTGLWTASPAERLAVLLRASDVPIGVATDGRWWAIVWAPRGGAVGIAVWDASLFSEEPESLAALVALLTRARFLGIADDDRLPELLLESAERQEDVTDQLGTQVQQAVELLVATFDQLDVESGCTMLAGVDDDELFSGAVAIMMRIIFILFAEERRLLPSDHALYQDGYSIGGLEAELSELGELYGEQTLEHRTGAWHQLLATSRAVHSGVANEDLRLPAYGGTLFDPDRHPWLEGRIGDAHLGVAHAPAIDDRTMRRILRAVQYVELGTGKNRELRRLTFRALGVEQIGYVYEGLLELEVNTANEVVVHLERPKDWPRPEWLCDVGVSEVQGWVDQGPPTVVAQIRKRTGWSAEKVDKKLGEAVDDAALTKILRGHATAVETVRAVAPALRRDDDDMPWVTLPGRRYVAKSTRRPSTGTFYTPPELAERIVTGALEPLVYRPGPLETADRNSWVLRSSTEIQSLRAVDIAMGSGAFLVAACRYLADRLREAQVAEGVPGAEEGGAHIATAVADAEVTPALLAARRTIADRCLYGVDVNSLAVEMGKLSLWLLTMDPQRPFGFLDDRLVLGDSLLGVASIEQLDTLHIDPDAGRRLHEAGFEFSDAWAASLATAAATRSTILAHDVASIRDVEYKQNLLAVATEATADLDAVADYLTGVGLATAAANAKKSDAAFVASSIEIGNRLGSSIDLLRTGAEALIQQGNPAAMSARRPLHWPLVFPEVFDDQGDPGFDAIIGNPPFVGGQKITGTLGKDYAAWLQRYDGGGVKGSSDLAARFVLRAVKLLNRSGQLGFICTNTIVQGATLKVGMQQAVQRGLTIRKGLSSHAWPSKSANLEIVEFWASKASIADGGERLLDDEPVPQIGPDLELVGRVKGPKYVLSENNDLAFIGSYVLGLGFTMGPDESAALIASDERNSEALMPYVIGKDLNQRPDHSASRWIVNFRDWPLDRAETYPDLIEIVRRKVKPERDKNNRQNYRDYWWRYGEHRPGLYAAIDGLDHVLALSLVSSSVSPVRVTQGPVYSHKCAVFASDSFALLAFLASSVHVSWTVRYTSTMRRDINYSPSDVFLTLPRPPATALLHELGERLDSERRELMLSRSWGLTTTYNYVHAPNYDDPAVKNLRDIHSAIDHAVLAAYDWSDLDPQIGHHLTKIGTRWTFSPAARFELLDRLLEENHTRHATEKKS